MKIRAQGPAVYKYGRMAGMEIFFKKDVNDTDLSQSLNISPSQPFFLDVFPLEPITLWEVISRSRRSSVLRRLIALINLLKKLFYYLGAIRLVNVLDISVSIFSIG